MPVVTVGGGAAALTGLVFVAMTLSVAAIRKDPAHRYRAIGTLIGFAAAFVICALVLMGDQDNRASGAEWLVVSAVAAAVYVGGYVQAVRTGENRSAIRVNRVVFGTVCCGAEMTGAAGLRKRRRFQVVLRRSDRHGGSAGLGVQ